MIRRHRMVYLPRQFLAIDAFDGRFTGA